MKFIMQCLSAVLVPQRESTRRWRSVAIRTNRSGSWSDFHRALLPTRGARRGPEAG